MSKSSSLIDPAVRQRLFDRLGRGLQEQVPLAPLTTIKIGGPAELFYAARTARQLVTAIEIAQEEQIQSWLLGGGSNLVISDDGLPGLVIVDNNREVFDLSPSFIKVSSGISLAEIVEACRQHSLTGFEFAVGIPGSIGGAVCGNAGAYGSTVGECLLEAEVWTPDGRTQRVTPEFFQFEYRESVFKRTRGIVLSATFRVAPGDRARIEEIMERNMKRRLERLPPPQLPSAGSFFKNLPAERPGEMRRAAGLFLEQAGVKGMTVGQAQVYEKHANIIVNRGGATARQVRTLAGKMKAAVREKFGIELEEEARYLGLIEELPPECAASR